MKYTTNDRLTCFLYVLMRDHVVSGIITDIIEKNLNGNGRENNTPYEFCSENLAKYAAEFADRILNRRPNPSVREINEDR
jgi:hypothetical protein